MYESWNEGIEIKFHEGGGKKLPADILGYVYMHFSGSLETLINVSFQAKINNSTFNAVLSDVGE